MKAYTQVKRRILNCTRSSIHVPFLERSVPESRCRSQGRVPKLCAECSNIQSASSFTFGCFSTKGSCSIEAITASHPWTNVCMPRFLAGCPCTRPSGLIRLVVRQLTAKMPALDKFWAASAMQVLGVATRRSSGHTANRLWQVCWMCGKAM